MRAAKREKRIKNENRYKDSWDHMKHHNICIIEVPEGEEREQGIKNLFEDIMNENFPNLVNKKDTQIQKPPRISRWTQRGPHQDTS